MVLGFTSFLKTFLLFRASEGDSSQKPRFVINNLKQLNSG